MTHEKNVFSCGAGEVVLLSKVHHPMKSLRLEVYGLFEGEWDNARGTLVMARY